MWKKDTSPTTNDWFICIVDGRRVPLQYKHNRYWMAIDGTTYMEGEVSWFDDSEIVFWGDNLLNKKTEIKISSINQTCGACPSQWDAETTDGQSVYIRVRHGYLNLDVDDETIFDGNPDGVDGVMSTHEMIVYVTQESKKIIFI